ncbi:hypothetical protein ACODM8_02880 [Vibrio ostreicida]|uniref:EamA domain-containing protein n=1 Tax=Vibrio ostreicida TaxID=526588 RepID=A0ABT8BTI6_9VIBR|nr:hypothetical protein [Vibrio ostreicida]MDN3610455.1 hypothetical protein [Vibrio ostreicida]NPD07541.1 hypothetical protein [Vibrio ostreicida]
MVFSTFQFLVATLFAVLCAYAIGLSQGEISVLALVIPALWVFPQVGYAGLVLITGLVLYGWMLPAQPISLSVSQWILFPLLMVVFSDKSTLGVKVTTLLVVVTLLVGIMVTQSGGKLGGTPLATGVQALSVGIVWCAVRYFQPSNARGWWALLLILPLWLSGQPYAALLALCLTGMAASIDYLAKLTSFEWASLLCWTLPTVGFAALVVSPRTEVPSPVFAAWICLLGTAWMTDYILRSTDEGADI